MTVALELLPCLHLQGTSAAWATWFCTQTGKRAASRRAGVSTTTALALGRNVDQINGRLYCWPGRGINLNQKILVLHHLLWSAE